MSNGSESEQTRFFTIPHRSTVGLANDHAGLGLKEVIRRTLAEHCDEVIDVGVDTDTPVDFPDITRRAVELITSGRTDRVVLVCGTGAGACIAANKTPGIRAAVVHDTYVARQSVEHDDVNVICVGAWIVGPQIARDVVEAFLAASFSTEPQFRRRVAKLADLERTAD